MTFKPMVARLEEVEQGRVVVTCPACEEKYVFRSTKLPQLGGSFNCKVCRARVFLPDVRRADDETMTAIASMASLPAAAAPASIGERRATLASDLSPSDPPKGRPTILVVEDTEFFLQLAADALAPHYTPVTARTSAEALALIAQGRIDAAIVDLTLENEEDGLEVLAAAASRGIPSLIFTARNEAELWGEGWTRLQQLGARDLLIKGMNIDDQILDKVAELLRS